MRRAGRALALAQFLTMALALALTTGASAEETKLKMEDEFFIKLCKKNPAASGCVAKVQKCKDAKSTLQGYNAVVCAAVLKEIPLVKQAPPQPAGTQDAEEKQAYKQSVDLGGAPQTGPTTPTPGKPTPVRKPKKKLTGAQLLKIVEIVCPKKPNVKLCRQVRQACYSNWRTAKASARTTCRKMGWVPSYANGSSSGRRRSSGGGRNTTKTQLNLGGTLMMLTDDPVWDSNNGFIQLHLQTSAIDTPSGLALDFDIGAGALTGKGKSRLWFEFSLNAGLGIWLGKGFGVAALVGFAGGGLEEAAPSDWIGCLSAIAVAEITDEATLLLRARGYWMHDEMVRKRRSPTLSMGDELLVQAQIYYGRPPSMRRDRGAWNWVFGAQLREMLDQRIYGVFVGLGHAQR